MLTALLRGGDDILPRNTEAGRRPLPTVKSPSWEEVELVQGMSSHSGPKLIEILCVFQYALVGLCFQNII